MFGNGPNWVRSPLMTTRPSPRENVVRPRSGDQDPHDIVNRKWSATVREKLGRIDAHLAGQKTKVREDILPDLFEEVSYSRLELSSRAAALTNRRAPIWAPTSLRGPLPQPSHTTATSPSALEAQQNAS